MMMRSYFMILSSMLMSSLMSLSSKCYWYLDFSILLSAGHVLSVSMLNDKSSSLFVCTVLTIFSMVFLYSFSYLSEEVYLKRFLTILTMFGFSMCILILSGNLFSSIIGWDGLGVTSLFLILFYYSKSAFKASFLTFLMNRTGDCFFILALIQYVILNEVQSWHPHWWPFSSNILTVLLILTSITKSAQIPFSTWLPAAMEAPTPVSALVHSSTLVTAGIWMLFRYYQIWVYTNIWKMLLTLSISTCLMAAMSAMVENDLKKLIALSTLSQLGFIMFGMSLGLLTQSFMHLLMHAFFKALLFMCAGLIIHSFNSVQSVTDMSLSKGQNPLLIMIMGSSIMSLAGLPFLSGFYSKDMIIDSLKSGLWGVVTYSALVVSLVCTMLYSTRLLWYMMNSKSNWNSMSMENFNMVKPMILLALMSSVGGSSITWLLSDVNTYVNSSKVFIMMILSITSVYYWYIKKFASSFFLESKWNLSTYNTMLSNSFFTSTKEYDNSSDMMGIPEITIRNKLMKSLKESTHTLTQTIMPYFGNKELFLFLIIVMMVSK